jgi:hypothetical protein
VSRREPLKPQSATMAGASPEIDVAIPTGASLAADADAESGEMGSIMVPAPQTSRGRGDPHRSAAAPRAAKASPAVAETAWLPVSGPKPVNAGPAAPRPEAWMTSAAPAETLDPSPLDMPPEEEDFGHPPSRLSGLRNMLVSLGRRSLIEAEDGADEAGTEPRFERATVRPAYHDAPTAEKEPAGPASAPVRVTAPPEFLPPRPSAEAEKEKEPLRPTPPVPRRERESPDEVQTLPSWRGQYRKKRYLPI